MIGNVREWEGDRCNEPRLSRRRGPGVGDAARANKWGPHPLARQFCRRYGPAARPPQVHGATSGHFGLCMALPEREAK